MAVAGNSGSVHYSCSKISVTGGNPSQVCSAPATIPQVGDCITAGHPGISTIMSGVKAGAFCFNANGGVLFYHNLTLLGKH
jgi:hypothetical protein